MPDKKPGGSAKKAAVKAPKKSATANSNAPVAASPGAKNKGGKKK